ncbi:hypothetical protein [Glycomyces terrestris]|uniref:Antitoxin n=1 Tax=Glycomyces terrestris TaxID=2493553 RepID=A0A426V1E8_9ACTN|nr:hypothetical protein [Glycomyces terrestris]RRS00701.1 hypothetical protein EIW28_09155 [Glycomyces terrestris]
MVFIQVRNVEEDLREAAKLRATELGLDLSTYVKSLIKRDLARPSMSAWLNEVAADPVGHPFDAAEAVREAREDRDGQNRRNLGFAE